MTRRAPGSSLLRGRLLVLAGLLAAAGALAWAAWRAEAGAGPATGLTLVAPDDWRADDPRVQAWQDAAAEAGFALDVVGASALMRNEWRRNDHALILPDALHRQLNQALLAHLTRRVSDGARLMLVHDAGVADLDDRSHPRQSRLSALAGVRYALPDAASGPAGGADTGPLHQQVAWVDAQALPRLRLAPGQLLREGGQQALSSAQPAPRSGEALALAGPRGQPRRYPVWSTAGAFDGQALLRGDGGSLLAGVHRVGRGEVLFVNLPLTALKLQADGLWLHSFLRHFAQDLAQLPQFSPMPDALGALVLNWQIDGAAAAPALAELSALGAFEQGPYSVHLAAGPDPAAARDVRTDLAHHDGLRDWVQQWRARGDEIGSHGGWQRNDLGSTAAAQDPSWSLELIQRNLDVIRNVSGRPVREYSAPDGQHPAWLTPWLRERGVQAYQAGSDHGLPPTRSYQAGRRGPADLWAFPALGFGGDPAFAEVRLLPAGEAELGAWLNDVADYCAANRTLRLVDLPPRGAARHPLALRQWLDHTRDLAADGLLRWMTMAQYADFANRRLQVQWRLQPQAGQWQLQASHPGGLQQMSWLLPQQRYGAPRLVEGAAQIVRDGAFWRITAGATRRLVVALAPLPAPARPAQPPASTPAAPAQATAALPLPRTP